MTDTPETPKNFTSETGFPEIKAEAGELQQNVKEQQKQDNEQQQEQNEKITFNNLPTYLHKRVQEVQTEIEQTGKTLLPVERAKRNLHIVDKSTDEQHPKCFEVRSWEGEVVLQYPYYYDPESFPDNVILPDLDKVDKISLLHTQGGASHGIDFQRRHGESLEDFSKRVIRYANFINRGLFIAKHSGYEFSQFLCRDQNPYIYAGYQGRGDVRIGEIAGYPLQMMVDFMNEEWKLRNVRSPQDK